MEQTINYVDNYIHQKKYAHRNIASLETDILIEI